MRFIKNFIKNTKEPLSYISDFSQVFIIFYSLIISVVLFIRYPFLNGLKEKAGNLNIVIKIGIFLILLILMYRWLKRIYNQTKYIIETNEYSNNLKHDVLTSSTLIDNYEKIIPPTSTIKEIYKEYTLRADKWAIDNYLVKSDISISINKEKTTIILYLDFFSKKKQSTVSFKNYTLKIPKDFIIKPDQISYDSHRLPIKPFFCYKKWRDFVKEGLERLENVIAGREFFLDIASNPQNYLQFYLDPHFIPRRTYNFYLRNNKMYADSLLKELICDL